MIQKENGAAYIAAPLLFEYEAYGQQKTALRSNAVIIAGNQTARSTLLERRHLVQAYTWHGVPLTTALTRLTLGFHARLERLWEWETLMPKVTPLPQKSHLAIHCTSYLQNSLKISPFFRRLDMIPKIAQKSKCFFYFF